MAEQIIDFQTAENDLLACATYLTQKIGSSDGHAEAVKEIIPYYLEKGDVDTAAQLADSVVDSFSRDKLLVNVAEKCAEIDDDEYALQLADAIEEPGLQSTAIERIAVKKATKKDFDTALSYIDNLAHPADALLGIAVNQYLSGDENSALKTIEKIDVPLTKVTALIEIAEINIHENKLEASHNYLEKAYRATEEIDFTEEKIRAFLTIAANFIESGKSNRAIDVLESARAFAEILTGVNRESFFANISVSFIRAGSIDQADSVLDLVANKTLLASVLNSYAVEFEKNGERDDALETLEEAYAIIKSEGEREIRDSRARFGIIGNIAATFADLHQSERGIEIALENAYETERNSALKKIAKTSFINGNKESALHAIDAISETSEKIFGLIEISDVKKKSSENEEALKYLNDAFELCEDITQNFLRSNSYNWLIVKFNALGETEKARNIGTLNLETISHILDDSHKAVAIANISKIYEDLKFEMNQKEKEILNKMLRKSEW